MISTLSFPAFPFKRFVSCIPTLPLRKFARTKEHHSWRVGKRETSFPGRELIFYRAHRVVKRCTCLVGQVFAHCSAIRSPSFVEISTLSFPTVPSKGITLLSFPYIPVQEDLLLHSHPPIKRVRANERTSSMGGRKARNELSGEGVDLFIELVRVVMQFTCRVG